MKLIVEGPDGAGKSNLVKALVDNYGIEQGPKASTTDGPLPLDMARWTREYLQSPETKIYDRHPLISELIYAPALSRAFNGGYQDLMDLSEMLEWFYDQEPAIIYCLPPFEVVNRNVRMNHSPKVDHHRAVLNNLERIYALYGAQLARDYARSWVMWHDYTNSESLNRVIRGVDARLQHG